MEPVTSRFRVTGIGGYEGHYGTDLHSVTPVVLPKGAMFTEAPPAVRLRIESSGHVVLAGFPIGQEYDVTFTPVQKS
jgi:hypothetical protein